MDNIVTNIPTPETDAIVAKFEQLPPTVESIKTLIDHAKHLEREIYYWKEFVAYLQEKIQNMKDGGKPKIEVKTEIHNITIGEKK